MAFHHPWALISLIAYAALLAVYAWSRTQRRRDLQRLGDWRLLSNLLPVEALGRRRMKDKIALVALAFLVFAAAGPMFGTRLKEVKQRGVDVFICIDTSRSMLAEDVVPNRLDKAKRSLGLLVTRLSGNRVGIVAFAKRAILQCPLTVDPDAAKMFLEAVTERTVPEQGTGVGAAIRLALQRFPNTAKVGRAIVLLTDGEDTGSDPEGAAREAKKMGVPVFTIGIGTSKGEVIKDRDENGNVTSFHKYKGEMVVSRLDDAMLAKIAEITGGKYFRASSTDSEIDEIADILNGFQKQDFTTRVVDRLQERYQPFALIALLLLLIEFFFAETPGQRFRLSQWKKALSLIVLLTITVPAHAGVNAAARKSVRAGVALFQKKDFAGAIKAFESAQIDDPESAEIAFNLGTANYAAGKFDEAARQFERAATLSKDVKTRSRIAYNAGHALFTAGKTDEALEKFKECLRLDPTDEDAKYNVEYIRSGKKPPTPPPSPSPTPNDKNEQKQDQSKGQSGQSKPSEGEKNEGQDQQEKKQEPQPKPGELSKEAAEQILQMSRDQESENMKARPVRPLGDKNEKQATGGEDW